MDDSNFKVTMFGGFNKKSVVDYVTKLVNDFNLENEKLKENYSNKISQKDEQILKLTNDLKLRENEVKNLQVKLNEFDNFNYDEIVNKLKEKDALIFKLNNELEKLKSSFKTKVNGNQLLENRVKKVKAVAKERVNEIIERARLKITDEYEKNIEQAKKEGQFIKDKAVKDAFKITDGSAVLVKKFMSNFKKNVLNYVDDVKSKAQEIVDFAIYIGQKIVQSKIDFVFGEKKNSVLSSVDLTSGLDDLENEKKLNFGVGLNGDLHVESDLFDAVEKLNTDLILEENED